MIPKALSSVPSHTPNEMSSLQSESPRNFSLFLYYGLGFEYYHHSLLTQNRVSSAYFLQVIENLGLVIICALQYWMNWIPSKRLHFDSCSILLLPSGSLCYSKGWRNVHCFTEIRFGFFAIVLLSSLCFGLHSFRIKHSVFKDLRVSVHQVCYSHLNHSLSWILWLRTED